VHRIICAFSNSFAITGKFTLPVCCRLARESFEP